MWRGGRRSAGCAPSARRRRRPKVAQLLARWMGPDDFSVSIETARLGRQIDENEATAQGADVVVTAAVVAPAVVVAATIVVAVAVLVATVVGAVAGAMYPTVHGPAASTVM